MSRAGRGLRVAAAAALSAHLAQAGPPYLTDDPVPTDRGHWEVYSFVAAQRAPGALAGRGGIDLNYGGAEDLQLTAVLPVAFEHSGSMHAGPGTVEVAAKFRLAHPRERSARPDVAIFPRVLLPTARGEPGPQRASLLLPLWLGKDVGPWSVFGGGGYQFSPGAGQRDFWTTGLALTRALGDACTVGVELYHRSADTDTGRSLTVANLGASLALARHWSLLVSGGPGLVHAHDEGQYLFYVALKADY